jgi:predicted GIY-YIG superfamily endonuclease
MSFLRGACEKADLPWPGPRVVDTARIARRAIARDEVRNCKLETLSRFFKSPTPPCHRALDDARATVAVLHGLMERMGPLGVFCLEDLIAFGGRTTPQQRTKRHLADALPEAPGVYIFRNAQGDALYVGTSRNLRTRVRSYFTASEQRKRMSEMVGLADRVDPIVCATDLEARVRRVRAALGSGFGAVLQVREQVERTARTGEALARAIAELPSAAQQIGVAAGLCAAGSVAAVTQAVASVNVSVQVSVQVSASAQVN